MKKTLSQEHGLIVDRLLSKLAGSLDGAVDLWTSVCLGAMPVDPRDFLLKHSELQQALVVVTRSFLAEAGLANSQPVAALLEELSADCQKLEDAFLVLQQFRILPLEEVHRASQTVVQVYADCREAIRRLARDVEIPIGYLENLRPEQEEYHQQILKGLFDHFCRERNTGQRTEPVGSAGACQAQ